MRMSGSARKPARAAATRRRSHVRRLTASAGERFGSATLEEGRRGGRAGRTPPAEQLGDDRLAEAVPRAALAALVEAVELVGLAPGAKAVLVDVAGLSMVRNVSSRIATRRRCGGRTVPRQRQGASSRPRSSSSSSSPKQMRHTRDSGGEGEVVERSGEVEGTSGDASSRAGGSGERARELEDGARGVEVPVLVVDAAVTEPASGSVGERGRRGWVGPGASWTRRCPAGGCTGGSGLTSAALGGI